MEGVLGIGTAGEKLVRCARLWVLWNRLCAQQARRTLQIEGIARCDFANYGAICNALSLCPKTELGGYDRNVRPHRKLTWSQLANEAPDWWPRVRAEAEHYGYGEHGQ